MFTLHDIGDTLVVFKKEPNTEDEFSDQPETFIWLSGQKIDPEDGQVDIFRDAIGYEWEIPATQIGTDKEYDWLKKCYPRVMAGYQRRLG